MKYLTKTWYRQGLDLFEDAESNLQAAAYTESYYRELYIQRLMDFLGTGDSDDDPDDDLEFFHESFDDDPVIEHWVEIGRWSDDDADDEEPLSEPVNEALDEMRSTILEQLNQLSDQELSKMAEQTDKGHSMGMKPLRSTEGEDEEMRSFVQQVASFDDLLMQRIRTLEAILPEDLKSDIADIRILALGEASPEVKLRLDLLSEEYREQVEQDMVDAHEAMKEAFGGRTPDIARELNIQDCRITNIEWDGQQLVLDLDNAGGFTDVCRVTFDKIALLELDSPLNDGIFIALEIYPHVAGYEIHTLLYSEMSGEHDGLMYFTLLAESVETISTKIRTRRF